MVIEAASRDAIEPWGLMALRHAQSFVVSSTSAFCGGNVRVGLEDSLWIGPGKLAESNAARVRQVRQVVEGLGLTVAMPDEAREILSLKGADKVAF